MSHVKSLFTSCDWPVTTHCDKPSWKVHLWPILVYRLFVDQARITYWEVLLAAVNFSVLYFRVTTLINSEKWQDLGLLPEHSLYLDQLHRSLGTGASVYLNISSSLRFFLPLLHSYAYVDTLNLPFPYFIGLTPFPGNVLKMPVNLSLYLVTDSTPKILGDRDLCSVVEQAVQGGMCVSRVLEVFLLKLKYWYISCNVYRSHYRSIQGQT